MYDLKEFGKRLRRYRRKAGLSQKEFADKAGIAIQSIERYEIGHHYPSVLMLQYMCEALGCTSDDLIGLGKPRFVIDLPSEFGTRLKYFRKLRLMSQKELVVHSSISISQIKGYENFRSNPNVIYLARLCDALDVNGGDLLGF